MPRLRRTSPKQAGWSRRRVGRGFSYTDQSGERLGGQEILRIRGLAIPPAWRDVWISPHENGHLQASGIDGAGRRQYLYHPRWRRQRDALKFARVEAAAAQLPEVRARVAADLKLEGMPLERAAAAAVRLLDLGYFRVGNDCYADANGSFGLTTLERRHVRRQGQVMEFKFVGKSGVEHRVLIDDPDVIAAIEEMRKRKYGTRLLSYRTGKGVADWSDLTSRNVNAYISELFEGEFTAKDFRTWHATVIAAAALAESPESGDTQTSRRRAIRAAVVEVAEYLGNTPAIAKASYVDPRVLDLYESGFTIDTTTAHSLADPAERQAELERAVLELLS